jgi:PRC-barrel domain
MNRGDSASQFRILEDRYAGYEVHDSASESIGKIVATFVDETGKREYVEVQVGGMLGKVTGKGTSLIPLDLCVIDNIRRTIEVTQPIDRVKEAPPLEHTREISPGYEGLLRKHYGL